MESPSCLSQRKTLALVVGIPPAFGTFSVVIMTDLPILLQPPSMNFAIRRGPVGLAHGLSIQLPRRSLGDLPPKLHRLGRLQAAQRRLAVGKHSALVQRLTIFQDNNGFDRLTPLLVGHS